MRAYGSKRTYGDCRTSRSKRGGKIKVIEAIKNHKLVRQLFKWKRLTER